MFAPPPYTRASPATRSRIKCMCTYRSIGFTYSFCLYCAQPFFVALFDIGCFFLLDAYYFTYSAYIYIYAYYGHYLSILKSMRVSNTWLFPYHGVVVMYKFHRRRRKRRKQNRIFVEYLVQTSKCDTPSKWIQLRIYVAKIREARWYLLQERDDTK